MILPVALLAAGLSYAPVKTWAYMPLNGEKIIGDYELTVHAPGRDYTFRYPEIDCIGGEKYLKNAEEVVEGIFYDTVVRPTDAKVNIYPSRDEPFTYTQEKSGRGIDEEQLLKDVRRAVARGEKQITAKEVVLKPSVTVSDLKKNTKLISTFSTDFSSSGNERKHNIALAAKNIGGVAIAPGGEFSFNDAVGERTEERGFKTAKIITEGKYTDGTGGGVCQVSTTVYNAAVTAGLSVTERHAHSLLVSYVEPSFDAMVNSGSADLRIRNDTSGYVYLVVHTSDDKIIARIYGAENKCVYKRVSVVNEYISPPADETIKTVDLKVGESKTEVYSKRGAKSSAYIEKYRNGKLVGKVRLSEDYYKPVRGVIYIGIGDG